MSGIEKVVKSRSKHAIASLPGNILRLSRNAGHFILKARPLKNSGTPEGMITDRLQQFEKKSGINYHFINEFGPDAVPAAVKQHLMYAAFSLQLHSICSCSDVSMVVVKLQPAGSQVALSVTCICMSPCASLDQHAAGFKKLQHRITQAGGALRLTSEPGSSYTVEISLPVVH